MFALTQIAGAISSSGRRRYIAPPSGGGGDAALLADWNARGTIGVNGVVQALRPNNSTLVNQYRHLDGTEANVVLAANDGIIGDGCLQINIPASSGSNPGSWVFPLNASWVTDQQGFGTNTWYFQCRIKLGPRMLEQTITGDGPKLFNISEYIPSSPGSSRSHPGGEIVISNYSWRGIPNIYRDINGNGTSWDRTDGAGIHFQTAVDRGAGATDNDSRYCLYNSGTASPGCWFFKEDNWITVDMEVQIANPTGGTGNRLKCWFTHDGDTKQLLWDEVDFLIDDDGALPLGVNGCAATPYNTNRAVNGASWDTWMRYDQFIVSTSPIAQPLAITVNPTWRTGASIGNWIELPNTAITSVDPSPNPGGTYIQKVRAWNSMAFKQAPATGLSPANGGHADYAGNEVNGINFEANTPIWSTLRAPDPSPTNSDPSGYYASGEPGSRHSYNGHVFNEFENRINMFGGSMWFSPGNIALRVDGFLMGSGTWLPAGTYPDVPSTVDRGGAYSQPMCADARNGYVYLFGNYSVARLNRNKNTWTTLSTGGSVFGQKSCAAFDTTRNRFFIVGGVSGLEAHHTYTPDSQTMASVTLSGSASSTVGSCAESAMEYIPSLDAYLLMTNSAGGVVYKIDASTFVCTTYSTTGGSSIPTMDSSGGLFKKMFYSRRLRALCLFAHTHTGNAWVLPLEA